MVVLDGYGLKTTRMIFPIYYKPEPSLDSMTVSTTSYSFSPIHLYMDPDEKFIFLFNRADGNEAGSDLVYFGEVAVAQKFNFPFEKIQRRVYDIVRNPNNIDTVYFSTEDGVLEYNMISNTLSGMIFDRTLALTRINETNKLVGILDGGSGYGLVLIFNQDLSVLGFADFVPETGGSFLSYSKDRLDYIVGNMIYMMRLANFDSDSEPPQIFLSGQYPLPLSFSSFSIDKDKNHFYAKDYLGVFIYHIEYEYPIMKTFYARPGADNLMAVDSWRNIIYYYTDRILYFLEVDYDKYNINELFYIMLPYPITNMWISPKLDPILPYLYLFSDQEILTLNTFPLRAAFIDQTIFQIGTKTNLIVYLIENEPVLGSYAYKGLIYDEFSLTEVRIFEATYFQGRSYKSYYELPKWMSFNPASRELIIYPENRLDVGEYNLFFSFSRRVSSSDFDDLIDVSSTFTSQDIFSELVKLGYLDNLGFLTLKFDSDVAITDLPSQMIDLANRISLIFGLKKYFTNYKISVVASLSLDLSAPPALKISALDSVQINIQIALTNAVFSPILTPLRSFAQLSEDRTSITLSGLKDAVDYSLTQLSMNIINSGANVTAAIIVNDFLNPTLELELSNITQYIHINNQPSLVGNPFNLLVIPLREWAYEIPTNLFEDANDRGDIISYDLFIVDHIANTLTPIPPFLSFDKTRNTLYAKPTVFDTVYHPSNNTYQKDYSLMLLATSTTGLSSSLNFTLQVKNQPPINFISISSQVAKIKFYTGVSFLLNLNAETFIDADGDDILFSLESINDGTENIKWITITDLTLAGEPPQEIFSEYEFYLVASDGISSTKARFSIKPNLSFSYAVTLIYSYIAILLGATVIFANFVWIHKILWVKNYRHPHEVHIRPGYEITYEDIPPIAIVSDLKDRMEKILRIIDKRKMISFHDEISSFEEKLNSLLEWSQRSHVKSKTVPEKEAMLYSLIFYHLIKIRIDDKRSKKLKSILKKLEPEWRSFVDIILIKSEDGYERAFPKFEINKNAFESLEILKGLSSKEKDLIMHGILGYAFNNHIVLYNQAKLCFKYFEKKKYRSILSLLKPERESRLKFYDYSIQPIFKNGLLTFSGKVSDSFHKEYIYFRILRSTGILKGLIIKEIVLKLDSQKKHQKPLFSVEKK